MSKTGSAIYLPRETHGYSLPEDPEDPETLKDMIKSAKEFLRGHGYAAFKDNDKHINKYLTSKNYLNLYLE